MRPLDRPAINAGAYRDCEPIWKQSIPANPGQTQHCPATDGGAPPQNWGHSKAAFGSPQDAKASGFQPGDSCNGHSGFLVNPPARDALSCHLTDS